MEKSRELIEAEVRAKAGQLAKAEFAASYVKNLRVRLGNGERPLPQHKLGEILGGESPIVWSTIARWEAKGDLGRKNGLRVGGLGLVLDAIEQIAAAPHEYLQANLIEYLALPDPELLGMRPMHLISIGNESGPAVVIERILNHRS